MPKVIKKEVKKKEPVVKSGGLKMDVYDLKGKVVEKITLSKEIFDVKVNKSLLSQAVRVYLANQRRGTHSTKTRGEINATTHKACLLYTSDAADDLLCVDLGG